MYFPAHAGVGWLLAEAGRGDERFRRSVFLAAILPDLDAFTYLLGSPSSLNQHHVWTHNILFSLLVSVLAAVYCRRMPFRAIFFTQLAFYTHIVGDLVFTQWPVTLLYPFSMHWFSNRHAIPLWEPINTDLGWLGLIVIIVLSVIFRRTPIEVLSPDLDARFTARVSKEWRFLFRKRQE